MIRTKASGISTSSKVRLGSFGQYVHAALGPLVLAVLGTCWTYFGVWSFVDWPFIDSLYFMVVTMTTVGLYINIRAYGMYI